MQWTRRAWSLAALKVGIKIAMKTAIIAITTNNSIKVKALVFVTVTLSSLKILRKIRTETKNALDYYIKHNAIFFFSKTWLYLISKGFVRIALQRKLEVLKFIFRTGGPIEREIHGLM